MARFRICQVSDRSGDVGLDLAIFYKIWRGFATFAKIGNRLGDFATFNTILGNLARFRICQGSARSDMIVKYFATFRKVGHRAARFGKWRYSTSGKISQYVTREEI